MTPTEKLAYEDALREIRRLKDDKGRLDWLEESASNVSAAMNKWYIANSSFREAIDAAKETS